MRSAAALLTATALLLVVSPAQALRAVRPPFEPTDLEMEAPGTLDIDLQLGVIRSQGPYRLVMPPGASRCRARPRACGFSATIRSSCWRRWACSGR
ncbi:MAG TPA: hypothetical protein VMU50_09480 [Polyangia bacterium]|nr:hypothetical protein [Polyangia bacterium]